VREGDVGGVDNVLLEHVDVNRDVADVPRRGGGGGRKGSDGGLYKLIDPKHASASLSCPPPPSHTIILTTA
jgi:hypothetical protein